LIEKNEWFTKSDGKNVKKGVQVLIERHLKSLGWNLKIVSLSDPHTINFLTIP
jgi:predicted type IV restriction endonuclease